MSVNIRFPSQLQRFIGGAAEVSTTGTTVGEVIDDLDRQFPGVKDNLCDEENQMRRFVNVYVNGDDIRFLANLNSTVKDGDEITIVPAIAGGCPG